MNRRDAIRQVALLMGGALSAGTLSIVLDSCHHEPENVTDHFTDTHKQTITSLADLILPRTDTPGALDAGVPDFVVMMINECYPDDQRSKFLEGLNAFNHQCEQQYGKLFHNCSPDQQKEYLTTVEKQVFAGQNTKDSDDPVPYFYRTFKELTLLGFFTSEPGATKALVYVPIPGKYEGCIPLKPGQHAWAM
ncbi:gluconate 2-dehydrogenase subunit 3-like protein [Thermoflavifilum aggregans]|uniref:Gluconate 2-dehydrogenase subunit 3-like protein n=1 Tax=Thermoflavifilum aggregans TaxID=454188 RepID=A0A2M9CRX6_9BACT|nr:gluconate 2-dehydrogenase subunit 3 family protein [Thermoflavifilum aggregans]PJJ74601.1 gluconate 2-dehydrogenase subunit 3-like protein [Thermoflavifilum aggregans]